MHPIDDSLSLKSAGQFLTEEAREAIAAIQTSVVPLFNAGEDGQVQLLGSAVLIEFGADVFLCTAKHVLDECIADQSFLYFCGPDNLEPQPGDFRVSANDLDTAVLKLAAEHAKRFRDAVPLKEDSIANQVQAELCKYVEFIGFPATKNKRSVKPFVLKHAMQCNGGTVKEITPLKVRVKFNKKHNIGSESRKRVMAPDPNGMSGGAMFGVMINEETITGNPKPLLIGISTDNPDATEVFGTNIRVALAIIRDDYEVALPWRLDPKDLKVPTTVMNFGMPEKS